MQNRLVSPAIVVVAALSLLPLATAQDTDHTRDRAKKVQAANAQPAGSHDLSGIWIYTNRDLEVSADVPPMTPEGKAKFDANRPSYGPRTVPAAENNDPMGNCDPLGLPRLLFFVEPVEFLQTPGRTVQFFEFHEAWRSIWTDGRDLPKDPDPRWMGYSVGKWDGDTFVVNSNGFDDRTWLDHFGNPHSDQMTIEERWHRVDHATLELTMTLTDPKTFTKPWVSDKKIFKLAPNQKEMEEMFCVPSEEQAFNRRIRDLADGKRDPQPSR